MAQDELTMVEIEVNSNCNKKCSYCPNSSYKRKESGVMRKETFEIIMHQLRDIDYKGRISYHFYNEPLLCNNLEEYIKISREYIPLAINVLYTNGELLNNERLDGLFKAGIDKLIVTKHENSTIDFESFKSSKYNDEQIILLNIDKLNPTNRGGKMKELGHDLKPFYPCGIPSCLIVITVLGNVIPCYEDFDQVNVMGNILNEHIKNIWNKPHYKKFREDLLNNKRNEYLPCSVCNNYTMNIPFQYDYVL